MKWNAIYKELSEKKEDILIGLKLIENTLREKESESYEGTGVMGGGLVGVSFFFFYYAKFTNKQEPYDYGFELLSLVFDRINEGFNYHTHAQGLAGIGSAIELLSENEFLEVDANELLDGLDMHLYKLMIQDIKNGNYDFLNGALGIAFYFLSRKSNRNPNKYIYY